MTSVIDLIRRAAEPAVDDASNVDDRAVAPSSEALAALARFDEPHPRSGHDADDTLRLLADVGGPATIAQPGPNYYGFVNGAMYRSLTSGRLCARSAMIDT